MTPNPLHLLQDAIAERLRSVDGVGGLTVPPAVTEEHLGDLESRVEAGLTGAGVSVVILTPGYSAEADRTESLDLSIAVALEIFERPLVNRGATGSGVAYLDLAFILVAALRAWTPGLGYTHLHFVGGRNVDNEDPGLIQHELEFSVRGRFGLIRVT